MTAVDLRRLEQQIGAVLDVVGDPAAFRRGCVDFLSFHADRTRRAGPSSLASETVPAFGVPAPVLRLLGQGLRKRTAGLPALAFSTADVLWAADYRETRFLAAYTIGGQDDAGVPSWVEAHVADSKDTAGLQALAEHGMRSWREAQPAAFVGQCASWLKRHSGPFRILAVWSLTFQTLGSTVCDLPATFRLLHGLPANSRGELRRALVGLIRALAQRSPQETAYFLMEELAAGDVRVQRLVSGVLPSFPEQQRSALRRSLSG